MRFCMGSTTNHFNVCVWKLACQCDKRYKKEKHKLSTDMCVDTYSQRHSVRGTTSRAAARERSCPQYPPQTFLVRWLTHFAAGLQSPKNLKLDKIRPDLTAPSSTRPVLSTAIKGALTSPQQRLAKSIQCLMKENYPPGKKHNPPNTHL